MNRRTFLGSALAITLLPGKIFAAGASSTRNEKQRVFKDIAYVEDGHAQQRLDIFLPRSPGPHPLIVWVHGGAWRAGSKKDMPLGGLIDAGFAVASVDYRLSTVAPMPAMMHDIKAAIRFLRAHVTEYGFDAKRFAVAGSSAGGHLAALTGTSNGNAELEGKLGAHCDRSSDVQAIVSFFGASNLQSILSQSTEHGLSVRVPALQLLLGGQPDEKPALAKLASPIAHVNAKVPPLLLIHGDADPQMPFEQSRELQAAYKKAGRPVEFVAMPGSVHGGKEFYDDTRLAIWKNFSARISSDTFKLPMNRRTFLQTTLAATAASAFSQRTVFAGGATSAAGQAHTEIWRRFVDRHGIMIDFTDLDGAVSLPTPGECREGKPNALGWWAPIENGAMFNGLYMDAAVNRWRHTKSADDAAKARRLMEGLLLLNSISDVRGFIGRGISTDGKSHYPMGSNDQASPWFLGLWRYIDSGLATEDERKRIVAKLTETTEVIVSLKWAMPAEPPFHRRGSFAGFTFDSAPRLLFVCKMMHAITGDAKWDTLYRNALAERGGDEKLSRLEVCERGMVFHYAKYHSWTSCTCVGALRGLWEMEKDEAVRAAYARGLQASADLAFKSLPMAQQFDNADTSHFEMDWRKSMLPLWKPQQTEQEAQDLAHVQLKEFMKTAPRRGKETEFVREPCAAAWIVTLAPDAAILKQRAADVERVIAHYDYAKLYYSQFFWVECAWWRLKDVH